MAIKKKKRRRVLTCAKTSRGRELMLRGRRGWIDGLPSGGHRVRCRQRIVGRWRVAAPRRGLDHGAADPDAAGLLRRIRRAVTAEARPAAERLRETR